MRCGSLSRRVRLERRTRVKDAFGQFDDDWTAVATVYAEIQPRTGGEALRAQAIVSSASVQIDIRYREGVTADMRAVYGSRVFNIGAALDIDTAHRTLRLICTEGENQQGG